MWTQSRIACLDFNKTRLLTISQVQRVQPLMINGSGRFAHGDDVDRSVSSVDSAAAVNHRCRGNANFGGYLATSSVVRWSFSRTQQRRTPIENASIRVECVNSIVFSSD